MQAPATALRLARTAGVPEASMASRLDAAAAGLPPKTPHAPIRSWTVPDALAEAPVKPIYYASPCLWPPWTP